VKGIEKSPELEIKFGARLGKEKREENY